MNAEQNFIIAQGKMAAFIATLLERHGVVMREDFGQLLACFAVIVRETEPEQADILALWAEMVAESAKTSD